MRHLDTAQSVTGNYLLSNNISNGRSQRDTPVIDPTPERETPNFMDISLFYVPLFHLPPKFLPLE